LIEPIYGFSAKLPLFFLCCCQRFVSTRRINSTRTNPARSGDSVFIEAVFEEEQVVLGARELNSHACHSTIVYGFVAILPSQSASYDVRFYCSGYKAIIPQVLLP